MAKNYLLLLEYFASVPGEVSKLVDEVEKVSIPKLPGTYGPFIKSAEPVAEHVAAIADRFPMDALKLSSGEFVDRRAIAEERLKFALALNKPMGNAPPGQLKASFSAEDNAKLKAFGDGQLWKKIQAAIATASKIFSIFQQLAPIFAGGTANLGELDEDNRLLAQRQLSSGKPGRTGELDPPNIGRIGDGSEGYDKDGIAHRPENVPQHVETARREGRDDPSGGGTVGKPVAGAPAQVKTGPVETLKENEAAQREPGNVANRQS